MTEEKQTEIQKNSVEPTENSPKKTKISLIKKIGSIFRPNIWKSHSWLWRIATLFSIVLVINILIMLYWSIEPRSFDIQSTTTEYLPENTQPVVGSTFVGTNIKILDTLLHKKGGFIKNDKASPGVFLDNISNWEYGVVELIRYSTLALGNEFSRSQSQSVRPKLLSEADNHMRIDSSKWILPAAEDEYEQARQNLIEYAKQITDTSGNSAQFYARADNLASYLGLISSQLGDITQQLSASVGDTVINTQIQTTEQAKSENNELTAVTKRKRTPYWKVDNNFYYARGYCWALLHDLKAIRIDFEKILKQKEALASLDQIIYELEKTQKPIYSPIILNGSGFGFMTNHSLIMASYISRANAAIIELRNLLQNG